MNASSRRRELLAALAAGVAWCQAGAARANGGAGFPGEVTLFVAGPAGGWLDSASRALAIALRRRLPNGTILGRTPVGGIDGVTGANHFAVQSSLDGSSALLVPGATPLAWLVGDSRVHFDPARWLPIMAQIEPTVVLGRSQDRAFQRGAPVRVASSNPIDPALAAMLAFDLLGGIVEPVFGLDEPKAAIAALRSGRVDAVLSRGSQVEAGSLLQPLFTLGMVTPATRELWPSIPTVPTFIEYAAALGRQIPPGPRFNAWRCAAAAAQLRYALVLPSLTPPSAVALWRQAGALAASGSPTLGARVVDTDGVAGLMDALNVDGPALLDLRGWMSSRLGWQPS